MKVSFPESFYVNDAYSKSPVILQNELIRETTSCTSNETTQENLATFTLITTLSNQNQKVKCESYDLEGKRFCFSPSLFVAPKNLVKKYNINNLTLEDLKGGIKDETTGYYFYLELIRVPIILFIFWVSLILMFCAFIYFEFFYSEDGKKPNWSKRIYLSYQAIFVIWAFQEGIIILTSLSRPLTITLFDLSIIIPLLTYVLILSIKNWFH